MDSLITAAALALAAGDPLGALNRVALRDDAPALALRGTAMAQLAIWRAQKLCCDAQRAPSLRRRRSPEPPVASPKPRSPPSRATSPGRRRRWPAHGRHLKHAAMR